MQFILIPNENTAFWFMINDIIGHEPIRHIMEEFTLSQQEIHTLRLAHRNVVKKRHADRIKAVILLGTGWSLNDVSVALLLDGDTLRRYVTMHDTIIRSW